MKKKLLAGLVTGIFMLGMGGMANAITIVQNGNIADPAQIDYWNLTLSSVSDVTINMLAYESDGVDFFGNGNDNDHLDTYVYLLDDTLSTVFGSNDDSAPLWTAPTGASAADGSVLGFDSYLAVNGLAAGNYTIAVGAYNLSYSEVITGVNIDHGSGFEGTSGLYQMTTTVSAVPEPATLFLFGTGLAGLVGIRRRKKQQ